jgi:hypothetical protein
MMGHVHSIQGQSTRTHESAERDFVWRRLALSFALLTAAPSGLAQSSPSGWSDGADSSSGSAQLMMDNDLLPSARAAGMSRALETTADDMDAAMFNPAGIGGNHRSKSNVPFLRRLFFPSANLTANINAFNLYKEFGASGGAGDSAVGRAIVDARAGNRQYARANLTGGIVLGRMMVLPINDHQVAAASQGNNSGLVDAYYRGTSGFGAGGSIQSPDGRLAVGYFGYKVDRREIQGTFDYSAFTGLDELKAAVRPYTRTLSGTGHNLGLLWRPPVFWNPTMALSLRDAGNTHFHDKGGGQSSTAKQNLAFGLSANPALGNDFYLLAALGGERLNEPSIAGIKKTHLGLELSYGGLGNYARVSLRGGVSSGGGSIGLAAHLGLLGFQAALQNLDIGAGNEKMVEQRRTFNLYVNVAEF